MGRRSPSLLPGLPGGAQPRGRARRGQRAAASSPPGRADGVRALGQGQARRLARRRRLLRRCRALPLSPTIARLPITAASRHRPKVSAQVVRCLAHVPCVGTLPRLAPRPCSHLRPSPLALHPASCWRTGPCQGLVRALARRRCGPADRVLRTSRPGCSAGPPAPPGRHHAAALGLSRVAYAAAAASPAPPGAWPRPRPHKPGASLCRANGTGSASCAGPPQWTKRSGREGGLPVARWRGDYSDGLPVQRKQPAELPMLSSRERGRPAACSPPAHPQGSAQEQGCANVHACSATATCLTGYKVSL